MDNKLTFTNKQQPAQAGKHSVRMPRVRRFVSYLLPGRYHGNNRALYYSMALLIFLTAITPAVQMFVDHSVYNLGAKANALVGTPNENLARKFSYNPDTKTYVFNEKQKVSEDREIPIEVQLMQHKLGGGGKDDKTLYSVDLPEDLSKGMTYYDNNLGLSFDLVPSFTTGQGKLEQNRLVYVNPDGGPKMVFTAMNNGLKEDMVFDEAPLSPDQTWQYKLNLPDTLAARTMSDGGVGIYSADPSLYKNVSFSGDMDEEKIKSARTSGEKTNLVFAIPAPFIKQSGGGQRGNAQASFVLSNDGKYLTVDATGLDKTLSYPLTVDPSVVITSTSDFATGNNEGNIDYPADEITGGGLTGGSASVGWSTTTAFGSARSHPSSVAYNGYLYIMGGYNGSYLNDVRYALLNSNGTINGSWNTTSSFTTGRENHTSVVYNGYMYIMGGYNGGFLNDVQYAPINANGTLGTWATTTAFTNIRESHTSVVYNGYLYIIGGNFNGTYVNTVHYAPIDADGTVGSWTATSTFTTARRNHASVVYNGYVYLMGGFGVALLNDVQYAPINANGTLGTWATTAAFTTTRQSLTSVVHNGYLYVIGGVGGAYYDDVQYAPLNANGTVGTWATTTTFTTARANHASVVYNGYMYVMGGDAGAGYFDTIQKTSFDPAGVTDTYATTTALPSGRENHSSATYNGHVYVTGGWDGTTRLTQVRYASIGATGTLGTWSSGPNLPVGLSNHVTLAYNGYLYVIGGYTTGSVNNVRYVGISSNGSLGGSWLSTTAFDTARQDHAAVAYNGYLYVLGGTNGTVTYADVQYALLNTDGTINGAWAYTTSFSTARQDFRAVVHAGYVYVVGGFDDTNNLNDVQYAPLNTNGTISGGTWNPTTAFGTVRSNHTLVVNEGLMYVIGGSDNATTYYSDVQYAPIASDGTVGSWATAASFSTARDNHTSVAYNGYLYVIGGNDGSARRSDVQYARINNNSGGATGTWAATTSFATTRYGHTSVAYNGYMYVIGGRSTINETNVQKGTIARDGTVGSWGNVSSFTNGRSYHTSVAHNGYLYVIGGWDNSTTYYADVQKATINPADGTLGSWTATTSLATGVHRHTSVVHNGYLYVIGGSNNGTLTNSVQYALLGADGNISGSWATTTSFMTPTRHRHSSVLYNGYLYVIGGTNDTVFYSDVQYAQLNANGTVTGAGWKYTTAQASVRYSQPTVAYNGYMYMLGGRYNSSNYADVQYAAINNNGTIGEWKQSTSFTTARQAHTGVAYNGFLYILGGSSGSNLADVQKAPISVMNRVGKYTKLVDLGAGVISGISYNGSLQGGVEDITYKVADDTGVFGATTYASDTLPGGLPALCASSSSNPTRYALITVTLDESSRAGFPDSLASNSNVTDVTVFTNPLRAPTNMRLAHGKWFKSQVQQPLDTCAT
ncbi:MAG: hypothetical protein WAS36_01695 [Candidatus Saccharimonadales bacterium]